MHNTYIIRYNVDLILDTNPCSFPFFPTSFMDLFTLPSRAYPNIIPPCNTLIDSKDNCKEKINNVIILNRFFYYTWKMWLVLRIVLFFWETQSSSSSESFNIRETIALLPSLMETLWDLYMARSGTFWTKNAKLILLLITSFFPWKEEGHLVRLIPTSELDWYLGNTGEAVARASMPIMTKIEVGRAWLPIVPCPLWCDKNVGWADFPNSQP